MVWLVSKKLVKNMNLHPKKWNIEHEVKQVTELWITNWQTGQLIII